MNTIVSCPSCPICVFRCVLFLHYLSALRIMFFSSYLKITKKLHKMKTDWPLNFFKSWKYEEGCPKLNGLGLLPTYENLKSKLYSVLKANHVIYENKTLESVFFSNSIRLQIRLTDHWFYGRGYIKNLHD